MNYRVAVAFLQDAFFFYAWVLSPVTASFMHHSKKELWPYFRIKCDLECNYGYETDVEGIPICKCYDPCRYTLCLEGTKCVVDLPKLCTWESCKPNARCVDVDLKKRKPSNRKKLRPTQSNNLPTNPFSRLLSDDATASSGRSVCYMPLTEAAKDCKRLRRRWYFDPETARCRKFKGCRTGGNNFGKKKRCKRKCMRKTRFSRRKGRRPQRLRARQ